MWVSLKKIPTAWGLYQALGPLILGNSYLYTAGTTVSVFGVLGWPDTWRPRVKDERSL